MISVKSKNEVSGFCRAAFYLPVFHVPEIQFSYLQYYFSLKMSLLNIFRMHLSVEVCVCGL